MIGWKEKIQDIYLLYIFPTRDFFLDELSLAIYVPEYNKIIPDFHYRCFWVIVFLYLLLTDYVLLRNIYNQQFDLSTVNSLHLY